MALERRLEGRDQLLKLVKRHAREIQELHRTGLQLGEPYTCHGSCLLSLYGDVRGASYQKESGINSRVQDLVQTALRLGIQRLDKSKTLERGRLAFFILCITQDTLADNDFKFMLLVEP